MDVETNIVLASLHRFMSSFGRIDTRRTRAVAEQRVQDLGIKTPSVRQRARNLSGGTQQKVVIAKWLTADTDILIFDEPTRGIDVGAKSEIYHLLNELAREGKSIIMISSELPEILRMSHRIIVMCEGRLTGELERSDRDPGTDHDLRHPARPRSRRPARHEVRRWMTALARPRALIRSDAVQRLLAFGGAARPDRRLLARCRRTSCTFDNVVGILLATSVNGILALGVTFVIITGGIDLSIGTVMTLSAVITGVVITNMGLPIPVGIAAGMLTGAWPGSPTAS